MNPRQRRGVLMIGIAVLGALAVFVATLSYVSSVSAQVGSKVPVLQLSEAVQPYQRVTPDMVTTAMLPAKWVSSATLTDKQDVVGLVSASTFGKGTTLQEGMLVQAPGIQNGYREIAMLVDARTGVGGKIRPGDKVDIIATSQIDEAAPKAQIIVQNALIIDVGEGSETSRSDRSRENEPEQAVPVTFAVPVGQTLAVSFAESFAVEVRLALRGGGDDRAVEPRRSTYQPTEAKAAR